MKIAMAQVNTTVGDLEGNRTLVLEVLGKAAQEGADLVVFPELCLTGYPPRDVLGLHGFVDQNIDILHEVASQARQVAAIVGFVDRNRAERGKEFYNAAAFLDQGRVQAVVHKTLLPTYDVFDEDRYFERGRESPIITFHGRRIGISICEDSWNPKDFWPKRRYHLDPVRKQVEKGADFLINISASPFEVEKPRFRYEMLSSHVETHRVPSLYLNLVGGNDDLVFDGNSFFLGSDGSVIAQGMSFQEQLLVVDTDETTGKSYRQEDALENLFKALVLGTRDYAHKCGFQSAVLGLSGGIDSAITACIAVRALGKENVLGVSMPSVYSAAESESDARLLAENLGMRFVVLPIEKTFGEYKRILSKEFEGLPEDITEENLQARIRGNLLMALSNKHGHLVLSTGNKSELSVGYCTLYGDMAGGLAVISDVPKTRVYQLARHINRRGNVIPEYTIERAPSAELRPDQKDQDTLPDYEVLDPILAMLVERQLSPSEVIRKGYDENLVKDIAGRVYRNEYKRRQAAPGLKVSIRAFGSGRRMPIAMKYRF